MGIFNGGFKRFPVVEALEEVHESLGTKAAIVKTLEKQGQIAAQRKK